MTLLLIHSGMDAIRWMDRASFQSELQEQDVLHMSATPSNVRAIVRALTEADMLIIPDQVDRCDATVESIKNIARQMEIPVMPMLVWMKKNAPKQQPATVSAEPQPQQDAVSGLNPSTP